MNAQEYISSGLLELYVAGALSEKENQEITEAMHTYEEVRLEVERIEATIMQLTAANAPRETRELFPSVLAKAGISKKDSSSLRIVRGSTWLTYTGWAAAIILAVGLLWMMGKQNNLREQLNLANDETRLLEDQIGRANSAIEEKNNLLTILRDKEIVTVPLSGQAVYPEAYAKVYWDKTSQNIYLDVAGLPDPPEGKVYQVWSLTLNPLTPTSLGLIDGFATDENKIFAISNPNASEAFGITLEPAGGSATPTMEQLYTLGLVDS